MRVRGRVKRMETCGRGEGGVRRPAPTNRQSRIETTLEVIFAIDRAFAGFREMMWSSSPGAKPTHAAAHFRSTSAAIWPIESRCSTPAS